MRLIVTTLLTARGVFTEVVDLLDESGGDQIGLAIDQAVLRLVRDHGSKPVLEPVVSVSVAVIP